MWRKKNPHAPLVGMQIGAATVEDSMEVPQKVINRIIRWPSDFTTGYLTPKMKTLIQEIYASHIYFNIIYNSQDMETSQVSIYRWME